MMLPGMEVYVTPTVGGALRALRSVCDGAVERDDVGFNQSDAPFGRKLSQIPEDQWSAGQRYRAWRMLAKYQAQLQGLGVQYENIPMPDRPAQEEHERSVFVDESGCFRLVFEYGLMLGEAYRLLRPMWVKDAGNHRCEATRAAAKGVRILAESFEFEVSGPALARVVEIEQAAEKAPGGTITRTEGGYVVLYEFDLVKNVAMSEITGARWKRELKGYYVPAESKAIQGLLVFCERFKMAWAPGLEVEARALLAGASATIEASKATDATLEVSGLGGTLRPFQRAGVAYLLRNFGLDISPRPSIMGLERGNDHAERSISTHQPEAEKSSIEKPSIGSSTGGESEGRGSDSADRARSEVAREGGQSDQRENARPDRQGTSLAGLVNIKGETRSQLPGGQWAGAYSHHADLVGLPTVAWVHPGVQHQDAGTRNEREASHELQGGLRGPAETSRDRVGRSESSSGEQEAERREERPRVVRPWLEGGQNPPQVGGVLLGDEPGIGKTIQSLAFMRVIEGFPALVICPASVKLNWCRETLLWLPGVSVSWLNGGSAERFTVEAEGRGVLSARANDLSASVVILNFDILGKWIDRLKQIRWRVMIIDEFHNLKSPKALRSTRALDLITATKVPYRVLLSGTPVLNRPAELLHPLKLIGRLDALGGWGYFTRRYCNAYKDRFGWNLSGAAHLSELNERLRSLCYIRRTKAEVLTELPEKTWSILPCELTNRKDYDEAQADVIRWIGERALKDDVFLASLKGLSPEEQRKARSRRAEDAEEKAARAEILVRIGVLKRVAAQGKREAARSWVEDFLETGKKLVVFAYHREEQGALLEAFKAANPARIFGEDAAGLRDANVQRFQKDEACRLMVASLRAGREGITLHAASDVLFTEQGWTPSEHRQAEDRLHRIGQRDAVTCWYLLARNTIDEDIRDLIEKKRFVVDTATEGEGGQGGDSILGELCARLLKKGGK